MMEESKEKRLKHWNMGTYLRVRSESFPMNTNMAGFRWFSQILRVIEKHWHTENETNHVTRVQ